MKELVINVLSLSILLKGEMYSHLKCTYLFSKSLHYNNQETLKIHNNTQKHIHNLN